ncbi:MAG: polysaccharide deacetylase family protein, partial [bacterium]
MGLVFDNGATRARALAWGRWLLFSVACAVIAVTCDRASIWQWACLIPVFGLGSWLILCRNGLRIIPVLNYHSVSASPDWMQIADHVSLTPAAFERQLVYLKRRGYKTLKISEVNGLLAGRNPFDPRCRYVALTLDDGYADNWIAAFPLLRKYGMTATMFVSKAFIGDSEGRRPTIEQCSEDGRDNLDWSGYLTLPELRAMHGSGIIEFQSHGRDHTREFAGSDLKGFVGPGKPNLWLLWNLRTETRRRWWLELEKDHSLRGHPVFQQAAALEHRAYRPDAGAIAHMLSWANGAGADIFSGPDWERCLREEWLRYLDAHGDGGGWESQEEYEHRVVTDLLEAKTMLERELGAKVDVLCWPENAFSAAGERLARQVGYTVTVSNRHDSRNVVGEAPDRIVRVFIGSHAAGFNSPRLDFVAFFLELKVIEGWYVLYPLLAVMH